MDTESRCQMRQLEPRRFHTVAGINGAEDSELDRFVEVINDLDNDAHCRDAAPIHGRSIHFEVYVDADIAETQAGYFRAHDVARKALIDALEVCDIAGYRWTLDTDEDPLPYDTEEERINAESVADWANIDKLWPTLKPSDYVTTDDDRRRVVIDVIGDTMRLCDGVTCLSPLIPDSSGISTVLRLDLYQLHLSDPFCGHGHDHRLGGCVECDYIVKCMVGGLFRRVVL